MLGESCQGKSLAGHGYAVKPHIWPVAATGLNSFSLCSVLFFISDGSEDI